VWHRLRSAVTNQPVAAMKRNNLYLIIGVLAVAVVIVGYLYYREQQKTRLEIKVNDQGLSVETN
jgi:hypothetical protein